MTSTTAVRTSQPRVTVEPRSAARPRVTAVRTVGQAGVTSLRRPAAPSPERRPHRRVRLTGRGRLLLLLALVVLVLGAFAVGRSASSQAAVERPTAPALTQVTVQEGDTLWSVARRLAPSRDPRDLVEQIERLNDLSSSTLVVGQQLLLPQAVSG